MPQQSYPHLALPSRHPALMDELAFPAHSSIAVLAPHPDDFDAIGVTLKHLQDQGHDVHLAVLTSGAGGIEDGWNGLTTTGQKALAREAEQRDSCRYFGLSEDRLHFLRLWEAPQEEAADEDRLRAFTASVRPTVVFLPHGNDSNRTHRRTYETFRKIALQDSMSVTAFLNLDAKTISMRPDVYMFFSEQEAGWKRRLLRFHRSQQERNLQARGYGFDDRVLNLNRESAAKAATKSGHLDSYAEVFELEKFGSAVA